MALKLQTSADYTVSECFEVDTSDNEDHSFCGIMFDVEAKEGVPLEYLEITHLWCRGMLGNITIWIRTVQDGDSGPGHVRLFQREEDWVNVYEEFKEPSLFELSSMELKDPVKLRPGSRYSIYIHSSRNDDLAIVYDNQRRKVTHDDRFLSVYPGMAHISPIPFDNHGW